jgi:O-antigen/teichoic acid export membrane protein
VASHTTERSPHRDVNEPVATEPRRRRVLGRLDHTADLAHPDQRSKERHLRIAAATVAGTGSRALTLLAVVVALPLASAHLNPSELGVWSLLVTGVALLGFADLGLSNGLVNVLSEAVGREDRDTARQAVTASFAGLVGLALVGAVGAAVVVAVVPWASLFNVDPGQVPQLTAAVGTFAAIVLVSIPAGIGQRVHLAYQQGWAASTAAGAGSALSLAGVALAALTEASLPWFVAAMLGGPALAFTVETIWVLVRSHPDLRPRRASFDVAVLRRLRRSGLLFFVLAGAGAIAYQTDTLVIAHYLGAAEVTRYAITLRLFTLVPAALAALLMPLWPAYGEALAREDHDWVRSTLRRSALLTLGVTGLSSLVLLVLARPVLDIWAPDVRPPSQSLLLAMALWAVVSTCSTAIAMYFNGANIIRFQVVVAIVMAASNLALSIVLVNAWGAPGPVWASVIAQTGVVLIPELIVIRPSLRRPDPSRPTTAPTPTEAAP